MMSLELLVGKVIGEFKINGILEDDPDALWGQTHEYSGISKDFYNQYFNGRITATAILVSNHKRYPHPLELKEVSGSDVAPQSFRCLG